MTSSDGSGPFDFIGDVHGCIDELRALLDKLGYVSDGDSLRHPEGRRAFFLGDLVNRGPDVPGVLRLVMGMVGSGDALCVPGNHDVFLLQALRGQEPGDAKAVESSLTQLKHEPSEFSQRVVSFIEGLSAYRVLDGDRLVAAHAGLTAELQEADDEEARHFAVFGRSVVNAEGRTVRYEWAKDYRGGRKVVYGHTPQEQPGWLNNTICIDTGCVYGGRLTALRYPELTLVSVVAARVYHESRRTPALRAAARADRN